MRWDNLFDDLESQLESELSAEDSELHAEEERLRLGRMSIRDRLAGVCHAYEHGIREPIQVLLAGGERVAVYPAALGKDWLSGEIADDAKMHNQCIIPFSGVSGIILHPVHTVASLRPPPGDLPQPALSARLSLAFVLRDLCRRRHGIDLELLVGAVHGTIDRVGRDHLDLAVHERGIPRRDSAVQQLRLVPLGQITLIRF